MLAVNAYVLAVKGYLLAVNPDLLAVKGYLLAVNPDLLRSKPLFARSKSRFARSEFWPLRRKNEMRACLSAHTSSIGQKMSAIASETTHTADVPPSPQWPPI